MSVEDIVNILHVLAQKGATQKNIVSFINTIEPLKNSNPDLNDKQYYESEISSLKQFNSKKWENKDGTMKAQAQILFHRLQEMERLLSMEGDIQTELKKKKLRKQHKLTFANIYAFIKGAMRIELEAYKSVPNITNALSLIKEYHQEGSPSYEKIKTTVERCSKRDWLLNPTSSIRLTELILHEVEKDKIIVHTQEDWNISWMGKITKEDAYVYNVSDYLNNTYQLYVLQKHKRKLKIVYNYYSSNEIKILPLYDPLSDFDSTMNKAEFISLLKQMIEEGHVEKPIIYLHKYMGLYGDEDLKIKAMKLNNTKGYLLNNFNTERISHDIFFKERQNLLHELILVIKIMSEQLNTHTRST